MTSPYQERTGGLWANMTDVQKMAHSIKTGSDWQNKAGNEGLRGQATEYLQYDNTPGIQGDNFDNGYYGWSPSHGYTSQFGTPTVGPAGPTNNTPPPGNPGQQAAALSGINNILRGSGGTQPPPPPPPPGAGSNMAGMLGAVNHLVRGSNGTQTPEQLEQTRMQDTQAPMQTDLDDIKHQAVIGCMGSGMSPEAATNLVNEVGPEAAVQLSSQQQQLGFGHQSQGGGGAYSPSSGINPAVTNPNGITGVTTSRGGFSGNPEHFSTHSSNGVPLGQQGPSFSPVPGSASAASPPGHGGGNPGFGGMLTNTQDTMAALKALMERAKRR